jgi:hypothetical protein
MRQLDGVGAHAVEQDMELGRRSWSWGTRPGSSAQGDVARIEVERHRGVPTHGRPRAPPPRSPPAGAHPLLIVLPRVAPPITPPRAPPP